MATYTIKAHQLGRKVTEIVNNDSRLVRNEVIRRAKGGGQMIRNKTLSVLKGQRSGKWYGRHQASAPGEPPATLSGTLRNSFKAKDIEIRNMNTVTILSQGVSNLATSGKADYNYAWLDEGIGKIKPRPYVNEVAEKAYKELLKSLKRPYHV